MCRWVEEVVVVAGADAGATKGVLGDAGTAGDSERGGMADGSARVPEVLAPAELEGFLAGFVPEVMSLADLHERERSCRLVGLVKKANTPGPPY